MYMSSGTMTASSSTVGSGTKPMYMSSGTFTASSSTVGGSLNPVYLSSGTLTACDTLTKFTLLKSYTSYLSTAFSTSLDFSDYDLAFIDFRWTSGGNHYFIFCLVGSSTRIEILANLANTTTVQIMSKVLTVDTDSISFEQSYYKELTSMDVYNTSTYIQPYAVYGVKL